MAQLVAPFTVSRCIVGSSPRGQRRSQVSLAGGADRIPGGGGDKPQYQTSIPIVTAKGTAQPRGGLKFFQGGAEPPLAPPWLRACSRS